MKTGFKIFLPTLIIMFTILFAPMPLVSLAQPGTTVIHFDPPNYSNGQVISSIAGVTFPTSPVIFSPKDVITFSPPYALQSAQPCNNQDCPNGASQLPMRFSQDVSAVSMRVGIEVTTEGRFCFPEGTACSTYARLVGFRANGAIVADSGDIFITDTFQGGGSGRVPIATQISITSLVGNIIRSATLYVGELDHENDNWPVRAQIDELSFTVLSGPPLSPSAAPTITLPSPQSGQSFAYPYQLNPRGTVTALGGLVAFCTTINTPSILGGDCRQSHKVQTDGSFNFLIDDTQKLQPQNNILYAFAFDRFGQMAQAQVPFALQTPPAPTIQIYSPHAGEEYSATGSSVNFLGEVSASGGIAAFCTRANDSTFPPQDQCTQGGNLTPFGSFSISIPPSTLKLASNRLFAFVYDRWGQTAVKSVQFNMPTDLRITAMEITQGIQTVQIPLNNAIGIAPYSGVKLVRGGKTIVRVFANAAAGGPFASVSVRLCTVIDVDLGQIGNVGVNIAPVPYCTAPGNGGVTLSAGGSEPTPAERADPNGAFVFTLPSYWTYDLIGAQSLTATITYGPPECATCQTNNSFTVTDVKFWPVEKIIVSPVEVIWKNSSNIVMRPSPSSVVFARTASISPLPENGLVVMPYAGVIDVTDLVKSDKCDDTCLDGVFSRVANFERDNNLPGYTIGISSGLDIGLETFVNYFRYPFGFAWEPIAVADELPRLVGGINVLNSRPLSMVTHEFYHQLAYYHAGTSCPNPYPSIFWVPDDRGRIQGIGLDRRSGFGPTTGTYRIIAPGATDQPTEWVDLMSYCFKNPWLPANGDFNVWISVRNWNAFGGAFPNGLIPDDLLPAGVAGPLPPSAAARVVPPDEQILHLVAIGDDSGSATILSVQPGAGGAVMADNQPSPYRVIVHDDANNEIYSNYLIAAAGHTHGETEEHFYALSAEVLGEGATKIEITYDDNVVAERIRSPNAPEVAILSPQGGDHPVVGEDVIVSWNATDRDADTLESTVEYSTDDGQTYRILATGVQGNEISLPARLFSGSQQARIRITVNDGFNESTAISDAFIVDGFAPQVQITEPTDGMKIRPDVGLRLVGQAFDDNNQLLDGEQLRWFAGDNQIGTGSILDGPMLPPGMIAIRLEATDAQGRMDSATVNIEVIQVEAIPTPPAPTNWSLIALVAIAILIVVVVIFIVLRRRATP